MTRHHHLVGMEETEIGRGKGDNRKNNNTSITYPGRDVTMINGNDSAYGEGEVEKNVEDDGDYSKQDKVGKVMDKSKSRQNIPTVTVENPTPTPRPMSVREKKEEEDDEELDEDEDDMDYDTGEEEEVEEEEEDTEMTTEEKKAMYETVKEGDIDAFEDCLDLPNADINMIWFQENLLMAAIRAGHIEMAEFLVDNGVDHTYSTSRLAVRDMTDGSKKFDRYEMDCRQMAFEYGLDDLVYLLDHLQGRLFSFVPAPKRSPRMRRPPPPPITPTDSNMDYEDNSSDADVSETDASSQQTQDENLTKDDENRESSNPAKKRRKKKKRVKSSTTDKESKAQSQSHGNEEEEVEEKDKTAWTASTFTEVDSGNYSMASSKLKKSMVEKHNQLLKLDLEGKEVLDDGDSKSHKTNSPKKSTSGSGSAKTRVRSQNELDENGNEGGQDGEEDRTETSRSKLTSVVSQDPGPPLPVVPYPPNDLIRHSRSADAVLKSHALRRFYTTPLGDSNLDTPLAWKKVSATGSYTVESKKWHIADKVTSKPDIERARTAGTISALTGNKSKSPQRIVSTASSATPSRTNSLLPPSAASPSSSTSLSPLPQPTSSSLSPASSSSSSRPPTISSRQSSSTTSPPTSILKTSHNNGEKHIRLSPDPSKLVQSPVASYMRPTQSTITKNRLHPRFVGSYGGLNFHHVTGRSQVFKLSLKSDKPADMKPPLALSMTSPASKLKSTPQRRSHNAISYRS